MSKIRVSLVAQIHNEFLVCSIIILSRILKNAFTN
jgi:hypothetical protein